SRNSETGDVPQRCPLARGNGHMFSRGWLQTGTLAALILATGISGLARAADSQIGKKAPEFRLTDLAGKEHSLAALKDAKLVVITFLGTECPLARLYAPRLTKMAAEYADKKVAFVGIDSNLQD